MTSEERVIKEIMTSEKRTKEIIASEERITKEMGDGLDKVQSRLSTVLKYNETATYVEVVGIENNRKVTYRVDDDGNILKILGKKCK